MKPPTTIPSSTLRGVIRVAALVVVSVVLLPVAGLPIIIASIFGSRARFRVVLFFTPIWGRAMAAALGLRLNIRGSRSRTALIFVGNHVTYLDIVVAAATVGGVFVSRHDVKSWPVIGLFARLAGTVFLDRSSIRSAMTSSANIVERARQGVRVVFFPEGKTSNGDGVREFRPFLFGAVTASEFVVQPFTIRYMSIGETPIDADNRDLVYWYDTAPAFNIHGWRMLKLPSLHVTTIFDEPVAPPPNADNDAIRAFTIRLHDRVEEGLRS